MTAARRLLAPLAVMVALLGSPGTALAYAPGGDAFVTCAPQGAPSGSPVTCTAGLFDPDTGVTVQVDEVGGGAVSLTDADAAAGADGTVDLSFDAPAGAYVVTVDGTRDGQPSSVSATSQAPSQAGAEDDGGDTDRADGDTDRADGDDGVAQVDDAQPNGGLLALTGTNVALLAGLGLAGVVLGNRVRRAGRPSRDKDVVDA